MQNLVNSLKFRAIQPAKSKYSTTLVGFWLAKSVLCIDDARLSRVSDRIHRTRDYIKGILHDDSPLPECNSCGS
jgi:hypothetical protein